jgi:hypothetical protein
MRDGLMGKAVKVVERVVGATRVPFAPYISIAVSKS